MSILWWLYWSLYQSNPGFVTLGSGDVPSQGLQRQCPYCRCAPPLRSRHDHQTGNICLWTEGNACQPQPFTLPPPESNYKYMSALTDNDVALHSTGQAALHSVSHTKVVSVCTAASSRPSCCESESTIYIKVLYMICWQSKLLSSGGINTKKPAVFHNGIYY